MRIAIFRPLALAALHLVERSTEFRIANHPDDERAIVGRPWGPLDELGKVIEKPRLDLRLGQGSGARPGTGAEDDANRGQQQDRGPS